MNILVSACLLGVKCRYDGTGRLAENLKALSKEHHLIPVCPEIFGGMPTPRDPAEQDNGKVKTKKGIDVTSSYEQGAKEVLHLARFYNCTIAILKERSPSCGFRKVYDGTFTGTLVEGNGVTADLLSKNDIKVFGESRIGELL